jgi:hypothetical protein
LAFSCFAASWYLDDLYFQTRPREPQLTEGRVYAKYVHHVALVYLTRSEKLALEFSTPAGLLFGLTAALFGCVVMDRLPQNNKPIVIDIFPSGLHSL